MVVFHAAKQLITSIQLIEDEILSVCFIICFRSALISAILFAISPVQGTLVT